MEVAGRYYDKDQVDGKRIELSACNKKDHENNRQRWSSIEKTFIMKSRWESQRLLLNTIILFSNSFSV